MPITTDSLKKDIDTLKGKLAESAKAGAKQSDPKVRDPRKALKRAQRRLRQLTGKKLAAIRKKAAGGEEPKK